MKRSLRSSATGKKTNQVENELNSEQRIKLDQIKNMAKKYEGKDESEILSELKSAVKKGKSDGSLTDDKMSSIIETLSPMLNSQQKNKLNELIKNMENN